MFKQQQEEAQLTKDDPLYHEYIQDLTIKCKRYELWYDFIKDQQLKKIAEYLSKNLEYVITEKQNSENFIQELEEAEQTFENLYEEQDEACYNLQCIIDEKEMRTSTVNDRIDEYSHQVDEKQKKCDLLQVEKKAIANKFNANESLAQPIPLQDEAALAQFKLINCIFFDTDEFDWKKFQKICFERPGQKPPAPVFDGTMPLRPVIEVEHDAPIEGSQIQPIQPQDLQQQAQEQQKQKNTIFVQKLLHFKADVLSEINSDRLRAYMGQQAQITLTQAYQTDLYGFQTIFEWLSKLAEEYQITKELEVSQNLLSKAYKEQNDLKKQYNVDFDKETQKFYEQGMEEAQTMIKFTRLAIQVLNELIQDFESTQDFFSTEKDQMQAIMDQLQGQLLVADDFTR